MSATPEPVSVELRECPFCGGDAFVGTITYAQSPYEGEHKDQLNYWSVNCAGCIATVKGTAGYASEAQAIEAWNRRTDAASQKRIGELEVQAIDCDYRIRRLEAACRVARGWIITCSESKQAQRDLVTLDDALALSRKDRGV